MMMFSVIIPAYNRGHFLEKAVQSVLDQTCGDFELVIVDDGSTDHTRDLIGALSDGRVRYFFQDNQGASSARNHGLKNARGRWIAFLDSDDWWLPQKLERAAEYIQRFPDTRVFHTEEVWYRRGKILRPKKKHAKPDGRVYVRALALCCISLSTAVVRRDVLDEAGGFDTAFEACEDYDLWLRITHRYPVKLIPEALTEKDGGRPDELSARVWGLDRFRILALKKMLDSGVCDAQSYEATLEEFERRCCIFARGAEKRGRAREAEQYRSMAEAYRVLQ